MEDFMVQARFPGGREVRDRRSAKGIARVRSVRGLPVVLLAAAVTAACGSSASSSSSASASATTTSAASASMSPSASASPVATAKLTGAAATALVARALANTKAAVSVRVEGKGVGTGSGSQSVTFDLTLVKNTGCEGTIALSKVQTFQLVEVGGYVWMKPSTAYYASLHLTKAATALIADKYIKVKSGDKQIGSLAQICTFSGLFSAMPVPTGSSFTASPASYSGQPVYDITQSGKPGYAYVTNTSAPLLLKLVDPKKSGGAITFTDYGSTTAITPTRPGPPLTRKVSAGAEPRDRSESAERLNAAASDPNISPAVTISFRCHPCWASSGICSMNRASYPRSRQYASSAGASSSLRSRISTELTLTGTSPAAAAASSPESTSARRSLWVSFLNTSGRSVSSETLIRSRPACFSSTARLSSPIPLVVSEISGRGPSAAVLVMMSARSRRSSGSPPVNLTSLMPSVSTPILSSRTISSPVSTSGAGSQSRPSGGMQYAQRRLQRSVSETRRSVATRP